MVRDDFWLAVSRFMQALEVRVVEGENSRLVDLFDERHARKVLAAVGRAFGAIPETGRSREQDGFLDQAVAGLAQDGKVVPVRLALFAEMVKSKPWTPAALREIGGAEGVGVAFLEETFSSPSAPPHHRLHQKTAQAVLAALLPEAGTDIKGHMRGREELLEAAGCRDQPRQFDEVVALLDGELRLVTPADAESLEADDATISPLPYSGEGGQHVPMVGVRAGAISPRPSRGVRAGAKSYQLTHDYLVPSLRTWLTRKQRATRQGRAELRLADLAALWSAKPEGRRLPSIFEFLQIRLRTRRWAWNEGQRKMMAAAARHHALRGLAATVVVALIAFGAYQYHGRFKGHELHDQLLRAEIDKVPLIIDDLTRYRAWIDPLLRRDLDEAEQSSDASKRLRASLALLPVDAGQADFLYDRLVAAAPGEFEVIRQVLLPRKKGLNEKLWGVVASPPSDEQYLRAAAALALYAPDDPRWAAAAPKVAAALAGVNPFFARCWTDALAGVRNRLVDPLSRIARDPAANAQDRLSATNILAAWAPDRPELLTAVLIDGEAEQFALVFPLLTRLGAEPRRLLEAELARAVGADPTDPESERTARRKARAAVALLRLGQPEKVWPLFGKTRDGRIRSYLIQWCRPLAVDPQTIARHWTQETDAGTRSGLLLLLGEFPAAGWPEGQRRDLVETLLAIFEKEPDAGLHAAAEWLLRKLNCGDRVQAAIERLGKNEAQRRADRDRRPWYVNRQGQTFVVIDAWQPFLMGSPEREPERDKNETQHLRQIGRQYSIAASPVTKEQFRRFQTERPHVARRDVESVVRTDDSPQTGMTWYEAAEYCNWLSEKEGISADQWCYESNQQRQFAAGMRAKHDYLALTGYRLPTEAEWEFACRAGTNTRFYFGEDDSLLAGYAWYKDNSRNRTWPVASLKPNDFGLFDMHGNVWQWCETPSQDYPKPGSETYNDDPATTTVGSEGRRVLRGGSYDHLPRHLRAACRLLQNPDMREEKLGFRPARTMKF
jgi:formylglycine-generating enzyme required for sulfatase activity